MDYWDVIYDQPLNESLCNRLETVQYKPELAIIVAIKGLSSEKL